jgi:hypothetical protein
LVSGNSLKVLVENGRAEGVDLVGPGGLLNGLTKTVLNEVGPVEIDVRRDRPTLPTQRMRFHIVSPVEHHNPAPLTRRTLEAAHANPLGGAPNTCHICREVDLVRLVSTAELQLVPTRLPGPAEAPLSSA